MENNKRVLLIWNDPLSAELTKIFLNDLGCDVINPGTENEAWTAAREHQDWRLVILHSTAADGFTRDLAEDINRRFPAVKIVVVTGDPINKYWFTQRKHFCEVFSRTAEGLDACLDRIAELMKD